MCLILFHKISEVLFFVENNASIFNDISCIIGSSRVGFSVVVGDGKVDSKGG